MAAVGFITLFLVAGFLWWQIPGISETGTNATSGNGIDVTVLQDEWNGQTYYMFRPPSGFSMPRNSPGADIFLAFVNNGVGYSPMTTFSYSSLTPGFRVVWVSFCHPEAGCTPLESGGVVDYTSAPPSSHAGSILHGWKSQGLIVNMTGVKPNSTTYIAIGIKFNVSAYDGPLTLISQESSSS